MSLAFLALAAVNLGFIGALPRIFFRDDGRKNLMWWATAAPFFGCGAVLVACAFGLWEPWYVGALGGAALHEVLAVPFACGSIALIAYTIGSHRVPLSLWHQDNDAPESIVTHGAYRYVRHPFYSAFLLALIGAVVACPHAGTLTCLAYAVGVLHFTACREERRLSRSEFGDEYRAYLTRTGRFMPRLTAGG